MDQAESTDARAKDDWWVDLYDELLAEALLVRADHHEISRAISFLVDELRLRRSDLIFDQCCGIGSLSIPLGLFGFRTIGVDQASDYIDRARDKAAEERAKATFHCADAVDFVCDPPADAALNWWTSYGYAPTREQNVQMLHRAFESLRLGGRFALDVPNLVGVAHGFEPERTDERDTPIGRIAMTRESRIDLVRGRLDKTWTFSVDGEFRHKCETSLELALPHQHIESLESVGFNVVATYADIDRTPLTLESRRCIFIAERPL